jgi:hypothetical protein
MGNIPALPLRAPVAGRGAMRRLADRWQNTCHSEVSVRRIAKVNSGQPTISHYRVVEIRRSAPRVPSPGTGERLA